MIRLSAAFVGLDFVAGIKQERNVFADATRVAISAAADGLKLELRQQVQAAGLGERVANAIGSKVYPRSGKSLHPAALVYPRGRLAERNGRHGRFLGCTNYPGCRHTENLE